MTCTVSIRPFFHFNIKTNFQIILLFLTTERLLSMYTEFFERMKNNHII